MAELRRLRDDLGYFAREVVPDQPLTDWQLRALDLATRVTVIVGGRQLGKSYALALAATWWAFRRPAQRVLIISASELSARRLLATIRDVVAGSELLADSMVDELAGLIRLRNDSEIRSLPSSSKAVRGWQVDLLILDEAGSPAADVLLSAALPTIAARPEARVILADAAWAAAGPFYDLAVRGERGDPEIRTHRWVAKVAGGDVDASWITHSMVELQREGLGPLRFGAEWEARFSGAADALFTRHSIERATADYYAPDLAALRGPARVLAGIDWGAKHDRSALVAIARLPEAGAHRLGVVTAKRWPAGAPLAGPGSVVEEIAASPAVYWRLSIEATGLGEPLFQELRQRIRERDERAGGGDPPPPVIIDPLDDRAWERAFGPKRRTDQDLERDPRVIARPPRIGGKFRTAVVAIQTTAKLKASTYSSLRVLIDRGDLLLPASEIDLQRELLALRVDLAPSGTERIEAEAGGYDDLADALAFATGPHQHRGEWRTRAARYAEVSVPTRGMFFELPERDDETVTTGGGIELPRRPILQSVNSHERTMPPGYELIERERVDPRRAQLPTP